MILNDIDYWEQEKNYGESIISVFAVENALTDYLKDIHGKSQKEIIDFGCGVGNALPFINGFRKIYAVDFSDNMLNQAKARFSDIKHLEFIKGDLETASIKPADVILSVSSVMPKSNDHFDSIIQNFLRNLKKDGEIIMVLPSFESRTMLFHFKADKMLKEKRPVEEISEDLIQEAVGCNYTPFGYIITDVQLIQKHWLKDEILYRLAKYDFARVHIQKLEMDWEKQIVGLADLKNFPKLWLWMVSINLE